MRALVLVAALAAAALAAAPAAGQVAGEAPWQAMLYGQQAERAAEADAARRRDIETSNALSRLEAQAETDRALQPGAAPGIRLPAMPAFDPKAPPPATPAYVQIPDSALAASNARAVAAAANRK